MRFIKYFSLIVLLLTSQISAYTRQDLESCLEFVMDDRLLDEYKKMTVTSKLMNIHLTFDQRFKNSMKEYRYALQDIVAQQRSFSDDDKQYLILILGDEEASFTLSRAHQFKEEFERISSATTTQLPGETLNLMPELEEEEVLDQPQQSSQLESPPSPLEDDSIRYTRLGRDYYLATEQALTCMICWQDPGQCSPFYRTTCGHFACKDCLRNYASSQRDSSSPINCPMCRRNIERPAN